MTRSARWLIVSAVLNALVLTTILMDDNAAGRVGYHSYGLTVFDRKPFPIVDLLVDIDGRAHVRPSKSRTLSVEEVLAFLGPDKQRWPDMLFIGTGYRTTMGVDGSVYKKLPGVNIIVDSTPGAAAAYNFHRNGNWKLALILHSTG